MGHGSEAPALVQSLGTSMGVAEPADHAGHSSTPSEVSSRPLATPAAEPLAGTWLEGCKALDEVDRWRPHFAFSLGECRFPFRSRGGGVCTGASETDPTELD